MQVYGQEDELIEQWQWNDPALRNLTDVVLDLLEGERGRVLDLGCGSGRLAAALAEAGFSVDGVDTEARAIAIGRRIMASRGLDVRLYAGDVFSAQSPVSAGDYDIVVCTEVLEHVADWQELLRRATELLRPGGLLVVSVPRDPGQFSVLDSYAGHLRRFRDEQLLSDLRGSYERIAVRRLGWPFMRSMVWLYTRALSPSGRTHAGRSQSFWRERSRRRNLVLATVRLLLKVDNHFSRLPLGTTLVVRAQKRQLADAVSLRTSDGRT
jgi:SAM-dependent methyltransferase